MNNKNKTQLSEKQSEKQIRATVECFMDKLLPVRFLVCRLDICDPCDDASNGPSPAVLGTGSVSNSKSESESSSMCPRSEETLEG